jgi:hypothetical protein
MGNSAKRDARAAEQAEKRRKALELRKAGATYEQIADQLKLPNKSVSYKLVKAAIKAIIREPAEEVLRLELERLDAMLLGCWSRAKTGDSAAIDRALRIMERRAAYLGLDAPKRNEHTGKDGAPLVGEVTPEAAAALVRQAFGEAAAVPTDEAHVPHADGAGEVPPDPATE